MPFNAPLLVIGATAAPQGQHDGTTSFLQHTYQRLIDPPRLGGACTAKQRSQQQQRGCVRHMVGVVGVAETTTAFEKSVCVKRR